MSAPALVLLHHFGGSARSWDGVIGRLGDGCDTLAPDLPGFGSAVGSSGPYGVDAYADAVEEAICARGLADYVLVGHSMGGKVALALAARQPRGLAGLVLLAPSPPTPEPIEETERECLIAGWGNVEVAHGILHDATARPLDHAAHEIATTDLLRTSRAAWTAWLRYGSREDIAGAMPHVRVPTVMLSGDKDQLLPTNLLAREVMGRLPTARLIGVAGAGHLLPFEAPDLVASSVRSFAVGAAVRKELAG